MADLITNCKTSNPKQRFNQDGYTLAAALTLIAIWSILMAASLSLWSKVKQREMEEELIFRGQEYVEAIGRYHQKFGTYPPDLETLEKLKFIRKLYKDPMTKSGKWKILHPDSLVQTGAAGATTGGQIRTDKLPGLTDQDNEQEEDREDLGLSGVDKEESEEEEAEEEEGEILSRGPVVGVVSRSKKKAFKILNGQDRYDKWVFVFALQQQQQPSPPKQPPGPKQPPQKPEEDETKE